MPITTNDARRAYDYFPDTMVHDVIISLAVCSHPPSLFETSDVASPNSMDNPNVFNKNYSFLLYSRFRKQRYIPEETTPRPSPLGKRKKKCASAKPKSKIYLLLKIER
jgi:hypothetical protein